MSPSKVVTVRDQVQFVKTSYDQWNLFIDLVRRGEKFYTI